MAEAVTDGGGGDAGPRHPSDGGAPAGCPSVHEAGRDRPAARSIVRQPVTMAIPGKAAVALLHGE